MNSLNSEGRENLEKKKGSKLFSTEQAKRGFIIIKREKKRK